MRGRCFSIRDLRRFRHRRREAATRLVRLILEQVAKLRLPAIYQCPELAEEGGLLGFGPRFVELFRERARMVARILKGSKPFKATLVANFTRLRDVPVLK